MLLVLSLLLVFSNAAMAGGSDGKFQNGAFILSRVFQGVENVSQHAAYVNQRREASSEYQAQQAAYAAQQEAARANYEAQSRAYEAKQVILVAPPQQVQIASPPARSTQNRVISEKPTGDPKTELKVLKQQQEALQRRINQLEKQLNNKGEPTKSGGPKPDPLPL